MSDLMILQLLLDVLLDPDFKKMFLLVLRCDFY